ncbi:MAG: FadR family transcriptional regulator [Chloroflexi bacterium]|nr:FadR family transcriptional regulator [Chloroflexota bacterium]
MAGLRNQAEMVLYEPVSKGQLTERVVARIQQLILSGHLVAGDRLPALRDLALSLGVSQTVVREAIRVLEERGLLVVRAGSGTYVSELTSGPASESIRLLLRQGNVSAAHIAEVRRTLEIEIAGLAAERATARDLEILDAAMQSMQEYIGDPHRYIDADFAFHLALAEATRNPIFPILTNVLLDVFQHSRELIWNVPGAPERGQRHHRAIHSALQGKDPVAARQAMREHLDQIARDGGRAELIALRGD